MFITAALQRKLNDILFTNHSEASGGNVRPLAGWRHTCHVCKRTKSVPLEEWHVL